MPVIPTKPPRKRPQIRSAPKIKQIYWCDFPEDAQLPEFWKRRPVLIFSQRRPALTGAVTVVPCTTVNQNNNKWAISIGTSFSDRETWAICDKITTIAVSRLSINKKNVSLLNDKIFQDIVNLVYEWLPDRR